MRVKHLIALIIVSCICTGPAALAQEHGHMDIAPFLVDGSLLTGGYDHSGNSYAPTIRVFGYEFGEDPADPFNAGDPGINQGAGIGGLAQGAVLRFNIASGLRYWDGAGPIEFGSPGDAVIGLTLGLTQRTLTGDTAWQEGGLVQTVTSGGVVHKHMTTSLYASAGAANVAGMPGYVEPPQGIYAFALEFTLAHDGQTFTSDPAWIIFNNGLDEMQHESAMDSVASTLVPEPTGVLLVGASALLLMGRRRIA